MAELNLNYEPAWLQQRPDSNQPMSLAEAFQLKQRQQQIDTEKALLPLRQQEMQARVANQALELKINQDKLALALKMKAADAAGWEALSKVDNILDPAQVGPIYAEGAKAGGYSPSFTSFLENIQQNAQTTNVRALEAAARLRAENRPPAAVQTLAEADKMENQALQAEAAGDTLEATRLRKKAEILTQSVRGNQPPLDTTGVRNADARLNALKERLAAEGKPPMSLAQEKAFRQEFIDAQTALPNEETITEIGKDGSVHITTRRGAKQGGPTVAAETEAQTKISGIRSSVQQLENMTATLRPEDVGVAGKIGEFTMRWVRQLAPAMGDTTVISNRVQAEGAMDHYLATQMALGRITAVQRDNMKNALFNPERMGQSYDQTIAAANKMKAMQRMDMITIAKSNKQPLADDMFVGLGADDYKFLILSRILTKEEALEWARKVNPTP